MVYNRPASLLLVCVGVAILFLSYASAELTDKAPQKNPIATSVENLGISNCGCKDGDSCVLHPDQIPAGKSYVCFKGVCRDCSCNPVELTTSDRAAQNITTYLEANYCALTPEVCIDGVLQGSQTQSLWKPQHEGLPCGEDTDNNVCTAPGCQNGTCVQNQPTPTARLNGTSCNTDSNVTDCSRTIHTCANGTCTPLTQNQAAGTTCYSISQSQDYPCKVRQCNGEGSCVNGNAPDGTSCGTSIEGDCCTTSFSCQGGTCTSNVTATKSSGQACTRTGVVVPTGSCTADAVCSGCDCVIPCAAQCGSAAKTYLASDTAFQGQLCASGQPQPLSPAFPDVGATTSWTCLGENGGANSATCTASRFKPPPGCEGCCYLGYGGGYLECSAGGVVATEDIADNTNCQNMTEKERKSCLKTLLSRDVCQQLTGDPSFAVIETSPNCLNIDQPGDESSFACSKCNPPPPTPSTPYCGDGKKNQASEQCDVGVNGSEGCEPGARCVNCQLIRDGGCRNLLYVKCGPEYPVWDSEYEQWVNYVKCTRRITWGKNAKGYNAGGTLIDCSAEGCCPQSGFNTTTASHRSPSGVCNSLASACPDNLGALNDPPNFSYTASPMIGTYDLRCIEPGDGSCSPLTTP